VFSVVVATPDVVGERMAGPGIRAWHLARQLARVAPVTLIAKREGPLPDELLGTVVERGTPEAQRAIAAASVLIGQPARGFHRRRPKQKVVYDLFDPLVLELRELYGPRPSLRQRLHLGAEWCRLAFALFDADLLISAAARQEAFYRQLQGSDAPWIDVPFGIDPAEAAVCPKPAGNIVIWGGGIWEWLDPGTAVEAIVRLNAEGVSCRLLFLGRARPNAELGDQGRDDRFGQLLAAGGPFVSANDEWIPYRERLSWLRAGKVAIMLHRPTAEAEVSIRTRLFDAIAAGVPIVATEKGFAAELVQCEGLGIVVPPTDVDAVVGAVRRLLTDDAFHAACVTNLERIRPRFAWEAVTRPLVNTVIEWQNQNE
jgi:glycosyltransferase involved in cell wall biosynthesis